MAVLFDEATSLYLPTGTLERVRLLAAKRGEKPANFMRMAILERVSEAEEAHNRRRARRAGGQYGHPAEHHHNQA